MIVEPLLDLTHTEDRQDDRNHVTLIAELVNLSEGIVRENLYLSEEVPDLVTVRRIPAVRQRRVNH